jgi:hypothetical protein
VTGKKAAPCLGDEGMTSATPLIDLCRELQHMKQQAEALWAYLLMFVSC